jgi:hypothetical protein
MLAYLAYGVRGDEGPSLPTPEVAAPVEITRTEGGDVKVRAGSTIDALHGIGFAVASERTWQLALLRRAALGELASWGGDSLAAVDALILTLRIPADARIAYEALGEDSRRSLIAFSNGVNNAFSTSAVRSNRHLLLGGIGPTVWIPWHTIAVERLMAWIVAEPSRELPETIADADRILRELLGLHGFGASLSFDLQTSRTAGLYARYVMGSSALPYLLSLTVEIDDASLSGILWPGTPFLLAGGQSQLAWSLLPRTTVTVTDSVARAPMEDAHYRIRLQNGDETIAHATYDSDALVLPGVTDTSSVLLRWSGFSHLSDTPAWLALLHAALGSDLHRTDEPGVGDEFADLLMADRALVGPDPSFSLITPRATLLRRRTGEVIVGPEAVPVGSRGHLTAPARQVDLLSARLDSITTRDDRFDAETWFRDTYSEWGRRLVNRVLTAADSIRLSLPVQLDALSYLRNWNYSFTSVSIAAAILDEWAAECPGDAEALGASTAPPEADTLHAEADSRRYALCLASAVSNLEQRLGRDLSQWRWERTAPGELRLPGARHATVGGRSRSVLPVIRPAVSGHPSALSWSPGRAFEDIPSPVSWEAWIDLESWRWTHRRIRLSLDRPLGSRLHTPPERTTGLELERRERRLARLIPDRRNDSGVGQ